MEKGDQMDEHHHDDTTSDGVGGLWDARRPAILEETALTKATKTLIGITAELTVAHVRDRELVPHVASRIAVT